MSIVKTRELPWASGTMRIETGHATSVGLVREKQEDRFLESTPLIAVADGMGGLSNGDYAAQTVIDILSDIKFPGSTAGARGEIKKALVKASAKLAKQRTKKSGGECGTTIVGAVLGQATVKPSWLIFHVGDSRLYSYQSGSLERLTVDHSVVQELIDKGIINRYQAQVDPRRSIVTRAIGTVVSSEPAFRLVEDCGQTLIACSDGITDELTDDEIMDVMDDYEGQDLHVTAQALVDAALESGGHDNATVVLARTVPVTMETPEGRIGS